VAEEMNLNDVQFRFASGVDGGTGWIGDVKNMLLDTTKLKSSMTCHRCRSRNTERFNQSVFHCWNCELWYNADLNAAINIGSRFLAKPLTRLGAVNSPKAGDEQAREIVACEPGSLHPSGVGASHMPSRSAQSK